MDLPPPQPSTNGHDVPTDGLALLSQRAGDLAAAAGRHAGLLLDEARFRVMQSIRESLLSLALGVTAVLASVVGYALLIGELAQWLVGLAAPEHPQPIRLGVYLLATIAPLILLWWRTRWTTSRDLTALEQRHRPPAP